MSEFQVGDVVKISCGRQPPHTHSELGFVEDVDAYGARVLDQDGAVDRFDDRWLTLAYRAPKPAPPSFVRSDGKAVKIEKSEMRSNSVSCWRTYAFSAEDARGFASVWSEAADRFDELIQGGDR